MLSRDREGAEALLKILEKQEEILVFDSFTNEDARTVGNMLSDRLKDSPIPVTVRVFIDDVIVYQYTMKGDEDKRFGWTYRKYQLIKKTGHSSMHGKVRMMFLGELGDLFADKETYGFGCGGFPIRLKDGGLIGAVTVSGLPDPGDHNYVVEALEAFLNVEAPKVPEEVDIRWIN